MMLVNDFNAWLKLKTLNFKSYFNASGAGITERWFREQCTALDGKNIALEIF